VRIALTASQDEDPRYCSEHDDSPDGNEAAGSSAGGSTWTGKWREGARKLGRPTRHGAMHASERTPELVVGCRHSLLDEFH
jgi:hypothetical protein